MRERPAAVPVEAVWDDGDNESIRTDTMTVDGAWQVLGRRGEQLDAIAAPIRKPTATDAPVSTDDDKDGEDGDGVDGLDGLDQPWPIREVLGEQLSPELDRWIDLAPTLRPTYRGGYTPAVTSSITAAVRAEDGTWLARLQGLFLPVSAVLFEEEEITHATWLAGPEGTSEVYCTHQDEPGFWVQHCCIAGLLAREVLEEAADGRAMLAGATRERWHRADALLDRLPEPNWPAHLSVEALYPRTGWIVEHLLTVGLEEGLAEAPGIDVWEAEREYARTWPHLQAYWLLHHLIFDNREELPFLVEHAERRHPAVAELAAVAESVLAAADSTGDAPASWWDATRVRSLRTRALDGGDARLMSEAAQARLRSG